MDDKRLERIESKLDLTNERLGAIDVTLGAQHVSLRDHVMRTNELQKIVIRVDRHVTIVNGIIKAILVSIAILSFILKLLGKI